MMIFFNTNTIISIDLRHLRASRHQNLSLDAEACAYTFTF